MKKPSLPKRRRVLVSVAKIAATALIAGWAAIALAGTPSSASSTPDLATLVSRYAKAMHFSKKTRIDTRIEIGGGFVGNRAATYTTMRKRPDKLLESIKIDGTNAKITVGYDGTTAWVQLPNGDVATLSGDAKRWVVGVATGLGGELATMSAKVGPEAEIDGVHYYVLRFRDAHGNGSDDMLDEKSYLPIYTRLVAGDKSHLYPVGPLDTGPLGELYPRIQPVVNIDGTLGNPVAVTSMDDNVPLADSMFAPP
jgi:hypothetical protein